MNKKYISIIILPLIIISSIFLINSGITNNDTNNRAKGWKDMDYKIFYQDNKLFYEIEGFENGYYNYNFTSQKSNMIRYEYDLKDSFYNTDTKIYEHNWYIVYEGNRDLIEFNVYDLVGSFTIEFQNLIFITFTRESNGISISNSINNDKIQLDVFKFKINLEFLESKTEIIDYQSGFLRKVNDLNIFIDDNYERMIRLENEINYNKIYLNINGGKVKITDINVINKNYNYNPPSILQRNFELLYSNKLNHGIIDSAIYNNEIYILFGGNYQYYIYVYDLNNYNEKLNSRSIVLHNIYLNPIISSIEIDNNGNLYIANNEEVMICDRITGIQKSYTYEKSFYNTWVPASWHPDGGYWTYSHSEFVTFYAGIKNVYDVKDILIDDNIVYTFYGSSRMKKTQINYLSNGFPSTNDIFDKSNILFGSYTIPSVKRIYNDIIYINYDYSSYNYNQWFENMNKIYKYDLDGNMIGNINFNVEKGIRSFDFDSYGNLYITSRMYSWIGDQNQNLDGLGIYFYDNNYNLKRFHKSEIELNNLIILNNRLYINTLSGLLVYKS